MATCDLLIINPGAAHGIKGGHAIYGDLGQSLIAVEPPLWARLIAAYVRDRGHSVKIIDAEAMALSPESVSTLVAANAPELVCLAVYGHQPSASTQQMDGAGAIARAIKASGAARKVIMLGGHVSALPVRTMAEENIDLACVGEGPATIAGILVGVPADKVPGLVWRGGSRNAIYMNPSAPLLDMSLLHGDAWDLLPMESYRAHNWQCFDDLSRRQPYAAVHTSLGCPYSCAFCCINAPFEGRAYRMRPPADVVGEIEQLYRVYGARTFKITDEMFVLNERHYTAIAQMLIESGLSDDINIWAYSRVDTVREGHLPLLRRAGFRWLALGIESASAYVRDGAQKRLRRDDIKAVVRGIQAAGINVIANYIFGLPDDDQESMQQTLTLALDLNTEFANFYSAMAYPGSPLYATAVAKGWALPASWRGYSQHNEDSRPLDTEHVSGARVLAFRDAAFQAYFTAPQYLDMIGAKFGQAAVDHVRDMTRYKLRRKLVEQEAAA